MNIIVNVNFEPPQLSQPIQTLQPEASLGASPENIARTQKRVQHYHNLLLSNLPSYQLSNGGVYFRSSNIGPIHPNQFKLTIECQDHATHYYYKYIIISIHCPSAESCRWLPPIEIETYKTDPADIYLCYFPFKLEPQGFALRDQLFQTLKINRYKPLYSIEREKLNTNTDQLFDLHYLWHNSQLNRAQVVVV